MNIGELKDRIKWLDSDKEVVIHIPINQTEIKEWKLEYIDVYPCGKAVIDVKQN